MTLITEASVETDREPSAKRTARSCSSGSTYWV